MGLMLLLKFALVCIDYLAWPAIALAYPLFASIRAVETDSKYHMKKLIIYWTLFSLISLFEFAFLKVIVWIPFWDSIRLIAIMWLVMPRFQGACHAYQILVRPVLSVDVQAVIDKLGLYKTKEDKHVVKSTFLDQYIKENGLEALERLIATKQECNKTEKDILVFKPEEKNDAATPEEVQYAETSDGPPETAAIKKCEQEWSCDICKVTTTSEITLNAHLQGRKHRSNCESLKGSKFLAVDTTTSSSRSVLGPCPKPKQDGETNQLNNLSIYCNVCSLKLNYNNVDSHVKGKRHMSNIKKNQSTN